MTVSLIACKYYVCIIIAAESKKNSLNYYLTYFTKGIYWYVILLNKIVTRLNRLLFLKQALSNWTIQRANMLEWTV